MGYSTHYLCPLFLVEYISLHRFAESNGIIRFRLDIGGLIVFIQLEMQNTAGFRWNRYRRKAIENCSTIIEANPKLVDFISLQQQTEARFIFKNIITPEDKFAFTICNHLFINHKTTKSSLRKVNNLESRDFANKATKPVLNFGGHNAELWCEGGELGFITQMIYESAKYPMQCFWFTTLVSKQSHLSSIYKTLNKVNAVAVKPSIWLKAKNK
jgi:23S rRNA (adenine1618-N6)-methyltransferase